MKTLMTVQGPMDARALGHFQMHEHIFVRPTPASERNPALQIDDEERSLVELRAYHAAGGGAILDAQPGGAGRDAAALRRLSQSSGVRIVTVTGYHLPAFYAPAHWIFTDDCAALQDRFLAELRGETVEGGVCAGAVKAAIAENGPEGRFAVCLRAAAGAAAQADVPLILHTERGIGAVDAVKLCEEEGLAPERIVVCHADRQAEDWGAHEEIARTGAFLEYDTIARYKYHDDASEIQLILHMLEFGCENRLLLSLDTTAARLISYTSEAPGMDFLLRRFFPALQEAGISKSVIENISERNPLRAFGIL